MDRFAPDLYFRRKHLSDYDAVLPRIGASITYYGTAVVRQFEQMNVFSTNSSWGIANSRDKLRSLQILSRHLVPKKVRTRRRPAVQDLPELPVANQVHDHQDHHEDPVPQHRHEEA